MFHKCTYNIQIFVPNIEMLHINTKIYYEDNRNDDG